MLSDLFSYSLMAPDGLKTWLWSNGLNPGSQNKLSSWCWPDKILWLKCWTFNPVFGDSGQVQTQENKTEMVGCKRKDHSVGCWDLSPCGGRDNSTHLALLNGDNIGETAQHPGPICKHRNFWLISVMRRASDHGLQTLNGTNLPHCSSLSWGLSHTAFNMQNEKWLSRSGFNPSLLTAHMHSK